MPATADGADAVAQLRVCTAGIARHDESQRALMRQLDDRRGERLREEKDYRRCDADHR